MGELSPWHLLIVVGAATLLFGSRRLPDAARSVGRSLRILKTEVRALQEDEDPAPLDQSSQPTPSRSP